jgi:hypothetical protein
MPRNGLRQALIPVLFALIGIHLRTRRAKFSALDSNGQVTSQRVTRDRVVNARVTVQRVNPDNPKSKHGVNVTVDHNNNIPHKTDAELREDAKKLQKIFVDKFGPDFGNRNTVVCGQDANGNLYYTVNQNGTDVRVRQEAESMGYNRISGAATEQPGKDHAEQIFNNARAERERAIQEGNGNDEPYRSLPVEPIRFSPDKNPCEDVRDPTDPKNQKCRTDSDGRVVGWP